MTNAPATVRLQLDTVNRRIEKHPLNSEWFARARTLVRQTSVEDRESQRGSARVGTAWHRHPDEDDPARLALPRSAKPPAAAVRNDALPNEQLTAPVGPTGPSQAFEFTRCPASNGRHVQ